MTYNLVVSWPPRDGFYTALDAECSLLYVVESPIIKITYFLRHFLKFLWIDIDDIDGVEFFSLDLARPPISRFLSQDI